MGVQPHLSVACSPHKLKQLTDQYAMLLRGIHLRIDIFGMTMAMFRSEFVNNP